MSKIAVLASGSGSNFQAIIDAKIKVAVLICSNDTAYAIERAKQNNIPVVVASKLKHGEKRDLFILDVLKKHKIDLVVLAGYLGILTRPLVENFEKRIINIHPSLLPKFAGLHGLAVHKAVIEAGEKMTGATVHFVDQGIDTGEIILQGEAEVLESDTPEILQKRVLEKVEHKILVEAIRKII